MGHSIKPLRHIFEEREILVLVLRSSIGSITQLSAIVIKKKAIKRQPKFNLIQSRLLARGYSQIEVVDYSANKTLCWSDFITINGVTIIISMPTKRDIPHSSQHHWRVVPRSCVHLASTKHFWFKWWASAQFLRKWFYLQQVKACIIRLEEIRPLKWNHRFNFQYCTSWQQVQY